MVAEKISFVKDADFCRNEAQNVVIQNLASPPEDAIAGLIYFNTVSKKLFIYNGTTWVDATSQGIIYTLDATPTQSSTNPVQSGGVYNELANKVTKNAPITSGTKTKVSFDEKGLVIGGSDLTANDIPDLSETYLKTNLKGASNGLAELDATGRVPSSQLPSFVDDVVESYVRTGATAFSEGWLSLTDGGSALTPEKGKVYVVVTEGQYQNVQFRWSGTRFIDIRSMTDVASESTAGVVELATQTETNTGTDDTRAVTPLKLRTYTAGMPKKITANNPTLTPAGGVCTWTITNTLGTEAITAQMIEIATGNEVIPAVNANSETVTIKINSTSNIAANTYKITIIG